MSVLSLLERGAPVAYALTALCSSAAISASMFRVGSEPEVIVQARRIEARPIVELEPTIAPLPPEPTVVPRVGEAQPSPAPDSVPPSGTPRVKSRPSTDKAPEKAPPSSPQPPSLDLEAELASGLDRRGLTLADIERLPSVAVELQRLRAGRSQGLDDLWAALLDTTLPTLLLRSKLDELRSLLTRRGPLLDPDVAARLEASYLQLETDLAQAPSPSARHRLAADIRSVRLRLSR